MRIDVVVFDGVDELDVIGPLEVLRSVAGTGHAVRTSLVTRLPQSTVVGAHGLRFVPDGTQQPGADALVVPGGGWADGAETGVRREIRDGQWPTLIARAHRAGTVIIGVCSGVLLLAHAGLLAGRRANTHPTARAELGRLGAVVTADRVVDDGDIVTCGGVTSGIDAALQFVRRHIGQHAAEQEAARLQYPPPR